MNNLKEYAITFALVGIVHIAGLAVGGYAVGKHYRAQIAETEAQTATAKVSAAASSASAAATSASAAKSSASAAKTSETNAGASATAAKASETSKHFAHERQGGEECGSDGADRRPEEREGGWRIG